MVATYESVLAIQAELAELSQPFGGIPDGWGTFGNGPTGQPPVAQDNEQLIFASGSCAALRLNKRVDGDWRTWD
jgi:hypothetical protein